MYWTRVQAVMWTSYVIAFGYVLNLCKLSYPVDEMNVLSNVVDEMNVLSNVVDEMNVLTCG